MSPNKRLRPSADTVVVRMYNTGFGDCFLLAFPGDGGEPVYMLIDCGVHHQYPCREEIMQRVVKDIKEATGDNLHVVTVTHEHTDHVYGFKYARELFDQIAIHELWLPWTEDPENEDAKKLREKYKKKEKAVNAASALLSNAKHPLATSLQMLPSYDYPDLSAAGTGGNKEQYTYLRGRACIKPEKSEDYHYPGEPPQTIPGVSGVKVYVLGPPKESTYISREESQSELYPKMTALNPETSFTSAIFAHAGKVYLTEEDESIFKSSHPFTEEYEVTPEQASKMEFFREHYGLAPSKEEAFRWRRIDLDWVTYAEQLALDLNRKTNNTSFVLAFELTRSDPKKVLLFTGDAMLGNWLSWKEHKWIDEDDGKEIDHEDLLGRTVLYKVGHHGSRNATPGKNGLELMKSGDLVAMIPVHEDWANTEMGWEHPAPKLLDKISLQSRKRVMRTDKIPEGDTLSDGEKEIWERHKDDLDWDKEATRLWVQYTISNKPPG
ncbi:MAG TPA: MBL fold metallo-hydrolase [Patescibacteria group bacterium]|nr:MBL fold metallo-hydrolase [Patescibacteria group bacterium]